MEKGYDDRCDIFGENLTNYPNWKIYPCTQLLDHKKHDNLQHTLSFVFYEDVVQTVNYLAHCQTIFQKNLESDRYNSRFNLFLC